MSGLIEISTGGGAVNKQPANKVGLRKLRLALYLGTLALVSCASAATQSSDEDLQREVQSALLRSPDSPPQLQVETRSGVVYLSGSLECAECAGLATPGGLATVQQNVGAVVRAVPGVKSVEFQFETN